MLQRQNNNFWWFAADPNWAAADSPQDSSHLWKFTLKQRKNEMQSDIYICLKALPESSATASLALRSAPVLLLALIRRHLGHNTAAQDCPRDLKFAFINIWPAVIIHADRIHACMGSWSNLRFNSFHCMNSWFVRFLQCDIFRAAVEGRSPRHSS